MARVVHILHSDDQPRSAADRPERDSVFLQAGIRSIDGTASEVFRVRNISEGGALLEGPISLGPGREILVELRNIGTVRGRVAWAAGRRIGISFDTPIDPKAARLPLQRS